MSIEYPRRKPGNMKWVPTPVIDLLANIKQQDRINSDSEAFNRLAGYAQIGRETNKMSTQFFNLPLLKRRKDGRA